MAFPFGQITNDPSSGRTGDINIIAEIGADIDRFGLCAKPGTVFVLNGNTLTIGRTGVFEIETVITSLTINASYAFILDYHIK